MSNSTELKEMRKFPILVAISATITTVCSFLLNGYSEFHYSLWRTIIIGLITICIDVCCIFERKLMIIGEQGTRHVGYRILALWLLTGIMILLLLLLQLSII